MSRLSWDSGVSLFEAGIDRGVFYPINGTGVAWSGIVSVDENVDNSQQTIVYFDGEKVLNQLALGSFQAALVAVTYPKEFERHAGHVNRFIREQPRRAFNLCYRTSINDGETYRLHLVYNALASPAEVSHRTISADVDITLFNWKLSSKPVRFEHAAPSSHVIIQSDKVYPWVFSQLEEMLYGTEFTDPMFPTANQLLAMFEAGSILRITNHGDGTWTATGPDDVVSMLDPTTFEITWPSVVYLTSDTYTVSSL